MCAIVDANVAHQVLRTHIDGSLPHAISVAHHGLDDV